MPLTIRELEGEAGKENRAPSGEYEAQEAINSRINRCEQQMIAQRDVPEVHVTPSPVNPTLQVHLSSMHDALASQVE